VHPTQDFKTAFVFWAISAIWANRISGIEVAKRHLWQSIESRLDTVQEGKSFMSLPAKQTQDVSLIVDDPERLLDVREAAALLHVKSKTLYAWVSRNKIPYRKICSLVRFHRGELIGWAKGQQQNESKATPNSISVVK
jgi:excisionase family DNA binding protein